MKTVLRIEIILLAIIGVLAISLVPSDTAHALPCCNNSGYLLCDPNSQSWDWSLWSWNNGSGDITISVDQCYEIWEPSCPPPPTPPPLEAELGCSKVGGSYKCTGTANGGKSPYTAYWKQDAKPWVAGAAGSGPFSVTKYCSAPMLIQFKVRDANGNFSNAASATLCGVVEP